MWVQNNKLLCCVRTPGITFSGATPVITYRQLETFLAVVRTGSVTKAAREVNAKQPTVSLQLRELRRFLGTPLFERPDGMFRLTPAGESLCRYAEETVGGLRLLQQEVAARTGHFAGPLSVGAAFVTSRHVLPAVFSRFFQQFPGVDLELHVEFPDQLFAGLLTNRLDVACYIDIPPPRGLTVESLAKDRLIVIASPRHPLAARRHVKPETLSEHPFVAIGSTLFRQVIEGKLRGVGVIPRTAAEAKHQEAGKELVERNVGYCAVMKSIAKDELASGRLVALNLCGPAMYGEYVAAFRSRPVIPPLVREFVRFVRSDLAKQFHDVAQTGREARDAPRARRRRDKRK
jgi:LysR family transcriptional regulator, low CO2-responsive transcriptional regulator